MQADEYFRAKQSVPSDMRTAQWAMVGQWERERAFFAAGVAEVEILDEFRKEAQKVVEGSTDENTARKNLQQFLTKIRYTPEPGQEGSIKDLRSIRRLQVMLRTNLQIAQGYAQKVRGMSPGAMLVFPAWELIRVSDRDAPRDWEMRWEAMGGEITTDGRMIALKQDLIWAELGSRKNFTDALGLDYPPFAWGSGMGWKEVTRSEAKQLGLLEGWTPKAAPLSSPNESLEVTPQVESPTLRQALTERLKGLAEWSDDKLVFTDPNGTKKYPAEKLAKVITEKLPEGFKNYQAEAVEQWSDNAFTLHKKPDRDVVDHFIRFIQRTEPLPGDVTIWRGEGYDDKDLFIARIDALMRGGQVGSIARGFSLLEDVALENALLRKYSLVIKVVSHKSAVPIYQSVGAVNNLFEAEKEIILLGDKKLKRTSPPRRYQTPRGVVVEVEVEEV